MTINSQGITSRQLLRVIPRLFINVLGCGSFSPENNYLSIVLFVSMDKSVNLAVFAVFAIRYQLNLDPILVPSGTSSSDIAPKMDTRFWYFTPTFAVGLTLRREICPPCGPPMLAIIKIFNKKAT